MSLPLSFLQQTKLDFENPAFRNELDNLQANILKGHGRDNVTCLFLNFPADNQNNIRQWIQQLTITSAYKQLSDRKLYKESLKKNLAALHDSGPVICFFLTASGYKKIGIDESKIPAGEAFKAGIKNRDELGDPEKEKWQKEYQIDTDAMLLIADDASNLPRLNNTVRDILNTINAGTGISVNIIQRGEALKKEGLGIEHFGYADALSQPEYLEDYQPGKVWDDTTPLSAVLVPDRAATRIDGSQDTSCYGSYFVFRKLEQLVNAFSEREELLGNTLFPNEPNESLKEVSGAFAVGRFENGNPVVKHKQERKPDEEPIAPDNDFNYSFQGDVSKCPYHAHIRLTNPRRSNLSEMAVAIPGYKAPERITRRGIPFDEAGRNNNMDWLPEENVGLLFMAYQYSLENCFETMQKSANIADAIIGQQTNTANQFWPMQWGAGDYQLKGFGFSGFVKMKGGEYFFAPSISFLKNMV